MTMLIAIMLICLNEREARRHTALSNTCQGASGRERPTRSAPCGARRVRAYTVRNAAWSHRLPAEWEQQVGAVRNAACKHSLPRTWAQPVREQTHSVDGA